MQVIERPIDIQKWALQNHIKEKTIGLVPTMGALHDGHFALVKTALRQNDLVVVSIFVNPLQFNSSSDLEKYPRTFDQDAEALRAMGVDMIYAPQEKHMYPKKPEVSLNFGRMGQVLEGQYRPGHFDGVGVVVSKLLHHVAPDKAYFGLKDLQQFLLIKRMVLDLSFPVEIVGLPTVRESSGLAMSSRNRRLSASGKVIASHIFKGLALGKDHWEAGSEPNETIQQVLTLYSEVDGLEIEYVELVNPENLEPITQNKGQSMALCVAAYVEGIRLIDNLYLQ